MSNPHLLSSAVASTLAAHLDEDATEYVTSLLEEDPNDEDARDAVIALVSGTIDDDDTDADEICTAFFRLLDFGSVGGPGSGKELQAVTRNSEDGTVRKLSEGVTLKHRDVTTYASGLSASQNRSGELDHKSEIATFYANMIDASNNPEAQSERARRKARQKALREAAEEEERKRAIEDAMKMVEEDVEGRDDGMNDNTNLGDLANDNSRDVHLKHFDLPNLRGGGPDLLTSTNLTLAKGRRYGLMGRNGCGKTTLMSHIAAREVNKECGGVPKSMSMLLVRQEIMGNDWSAVLTVLKSDVRREGVKKFISWCEDQLENGDSTAAAADARGSAKAASSLDKEAAPHNGAKSTTRQRLREKKRLAAKNKKGSGSTKPSESGKEDTKLRKVQLTDKLNKAYQKLAEIEEQEGGDPEPRARKVLAGLGFSEEMMNKPTSELSGGWRMRVSISCALFANPALLLLDEPTNHLDLEAVLWLQKYLCSKFTGTLVVVSHDRSFLNEVVTDVVHLYKSELTTYRGDISNFEAVWQEEKQKQIRLFENQEAKRQHLQKYIDLHSQSGENGPKAARQRKSRMKKLDKIGMMSSEGKKFKASYDGDAEEIEEYQEDDKVVLSFPDPGGFDSNIVTLDRASFGYSPDRMLLKNVDITVGLDSRIALLGRNGCGSE